MNERGGEESDVYGRKEEMGMKKLGFLEQREKWK